MRVIIKGGTWKNTEDEILKAAVMKYGKNQWARISSLLVRKTPKQCKARWFEWLDPSIKKTDWSKEEDEKLLHLAKLMPTQWRTIAPIVGRTPAQCLDRYQKLLDEAEVGDEDAGPTGEDIRRLRPGEVDPDPEAKPARPDPIDMDEDEKEMLSEARARLANTQGKKAKRKAREKQLDEAKRLANVQKRRELRAAGIDFKFRKRLRHTDYNADIPFQLETPAGFYDITEEDEREKRQRTGYRSTDLQKLEGTRRDQEEEKLKKIDLQKEKQKKANGQFLDLNKLNLMLKSDMIRTERKPLVLPQPQVSDAELAEIVKIGMAGETAKAMVDGADMSSKALLNDYNTMPQQRTPRVADSVDSLKIEARNLKAMSQSQTPLLGESLSLEGKVDFEGVTPKRQVAQTPNPLKNDFTPLRNDGQKQTPLRDEMGINTPRRHGFDETPVSSLASVPSSAFRNPSDLSLLFKALPKPKNEFEIVVPSHEKLDSGHKESIIEDAADVFAREQQKLADLEQRKLARRSKAVQRDLPRPLDLTILELKSEGGFSGETDLIDDLILSEMKLLIRHDFVMFPVAGQVSLPDILREDDVALEELSDHFLDEAQHLIDLEYALLERENIVSGNILRETAAQIDSYASQMVYALPHGFQIKNHLSIDDRIASLQLLLAEQRNEMKSEALKAAKLEKKVAVISAGYQQRAISLYSLISDRQKDYADLFYKVNTLRNAKYNEDLAIAARINDLKNVVDALIAEENGLQNEFQSLNDTVL